MSGKGLHAVSRGAVMVALLFSLAMLPATRAGATELIPAVGWTRAVDGDQNTQMFGSLAVRGQLLPMIKSEIAVAYREEDRFANTLKVRMWPVTGSVYFSPLPMIYAGGGVGWYNVTLDYDEALGIADETKQEFGVHLGGGVQVPLAPQLGVDLHGRYVMMREQDSHLVPDKFDPDFWSTSLGLAIKF